MSGKKESPDGRFKIWEDCSSDHFMHPDGSDWHVVDTKTGKYIATFYGNSGVYEVEFSRDGKEVLVKNALDRIIEKIDLNKYYE